MTKRPALLSAVIVQDPDLEPIVGPVADVIRQENRDEGSVFGELSRHPAGRMHRTTAEATWASPYVTVGRPDPGVDRPGTEVYVYLTTTATETPSATPIRCGSCSTADGVPLASVASLLCAVDRSQGEVRT
jgi:hypothetical protein